MKRIVAFIFALALMISPAVIFAADEGLHLGGLEKDQKKAKIEAKKSTQEMEVAKKKADAEAKKAAKKAEAEAKKKQLEAEKAAKQAGKDVKGKAKGLNIQ